MNATTPPADLAGLAQALRAQAASGSGITLDGSILSDPARGGMRDAFALPAGTDLVCAGVQATDVPTPANGSLIINTGHASVLGQTGVPLTLVFLQGTGGWDLVVTAAMKAGWRFVDSFPHLDRFPFDHLATTDARFVYATSAQAAFPWPSGGSPPVPLAPGLNFLAGVTISLVPALDALVGKLIGAAPLRLYGPFAPTPGQSLPVGLLRAPLGAGSFGIGVAPNALTLANPAIAIGIGAATDADPIQDVDLMVEADLDGALRFSIGIPVAGGGMIVTAAPTPGSSSIAALIERLPGGAGFSAFVPSELTDVFQHVALDNFIMVADASPAVTFIGLSIGTPIPWTLIPGELELSGLSLQIDVDSPSGAASTTARVEAQGAILPRIFPGAFDFTVSLTKQASWTIDSIAGAYYGGVSLGDIVAGLLGGDHPVPTALRSIVFSDFGIRVTGAPGARTYTIYGSVEASIATGGLPLPAHLAAIVTRTPTGHTIHLAGSLTIGEQAFCIALDLGGATSTLVATWSAAAGAPSDGFVSVQALLADLGIDAPAALAGVSLKAASLSYDMTAESFAFSGEVEARGKLPLGNMSYDVDVRLMVASAVDATSKQRSFTAHFETNLVIGPAIFDISFNIGAVTNVVGLWQGGAGHALTLNDIAHALGIQSAISLPSDLDLSLKAASFTYDATKGAFILSAESTQFGDAFFVTARDAAGVLGFVFGVDTPHAGHLSSLPGIGPSLKGADALTFQQVSFLVSTGTFNAFTVPAMPALPTAPAASGQPATTSRPNVPLAHGASLKLSPGLSLAVEMSFSGGSSDARMRNLGSIVGQPTLVLQLLIGEGLLKIFCALSGTVYIPAGGRNKLALSNPSVEIDITGAPPVLAVQMSGSVAFSVFSMPVAATAGLVISEIEAQVRCMISLDGSHMSVPVLGALPVAGLGVELGTYFVPPGVDLGLQGQMTIGQQARAFAVVLEMIEEAPNPLYLAFYIDKANLYEILEMLMPELSAAAAGASVLAPAVYAKAMQALSVVEASDLSFHWCDNVVVLPDGTVAQPGLGFSAGIKIFSWSGFAELEMSAAKGVSGICEMSAIDLRGILQVSGDGAGIKRNAPPGGGPAQAAPNLQIPSGPTQSGQLAWIVPPGGAVFQVNAAGPVFLHANWKVTLFDAVRQSVDVTVSTTGFTFMMDFQAGSVARFSLSCILDGKALSFSASGALVLNVSGSIGPIHVHGVSVGSIPLPNVAVNAGISVSLDSSAFSLGLHGSFQFQSASLSVPTVQFTVAPRSVAELPGLMLQAIQREADQIFLPLVGDVEKWADMVGRGVVTGVTDMASTLHAAYNVSAKDAARLMSIGKQSGEAIASGLKTAYNQTNEQVASLLNDAGYGKDQIVRALNSLHVSASDTTAILENTLHMSSDDALRAVKGVFTNAHVDVTITPHVDITQPPHGDAKTPHGDTSQPPHGDTRTGHIDTTQPPHADRRTGHADTPSAHADGRHWGIHGDIGPPHLDTGGIHFDTPSVHVDKGPIHADTPSVHADIKPVHTDTPSVHVDKSAVHTDTRI